MKRLLSFGAIIFFLLGNHPVFSQTATVSVPDTSLPSGRILALPIYLSDVSGLNVLSFDATLTFDSSILKFQSVTSIGGTDAKKIEGNLVSNFQDDKLYISGGSVEPLSGGGKFLFVVFKIDASAPVNSETPVLLNNFVLNEGIPPVVIKNGSVKIIRDTVPPVITSGPEVSDISSRSVKIHWTTDEPTTGSIEFGLTNPYGQTIQDKNLDYQHSVTIDALIPGKIYYYRVSATDRSGIGPSYSKDGTFTTSPVKIQGTDFTVSIADTIDVPIFTSDLSELGIKHVQFDLVVDNQKLVPIDAISQGSLLQSWGKPDISLNNNLFHVENNGNVPLFSKGILIWLRFKVQSAISSGTDLSMEIQSFQFNNGLPLAETSPIKIHFIKKNTTSTPAISLPDTSFLPGSLVSLPVYLSGIENRGIFAARGKLELSNNRLKIVGFDNQKAPSVNIGHISSEASSDYLVFAAEGENAFGPSGVLFYFKVKVSADAHEGDTTAIRIRDFALNQGVPSAKIKHGVIRVYERHDFVSGFVFDVEDSAAIKGVKVNATESNTGIVYSGTTDNSGFFQIVNLDTSKKYSLSAAKTGYTSVSLGQNIKPGVKNIKFYMLKENGFIEGTIQTKQGKPILGAFIVADDGHGHLGSANTDSTGHFSIQNLAKVYPYKVTATKFGFYGEILENVVSDKTILITMRWHYGCILGTVQDTTGSPVDSVWVSALDLQKGLVSDSVLTGGNGAFRLDSLITGKYLVYVEKQGFIGSPTQVTLRLAPGDSAQINFVLEEAVLASIKISGNSEIPNNQPSHFDFTARTASGRVMPLESPLWELYPSKAGKVAGSTVYPDSTYFGSAYLSVSDVATSIADTLKLAIFAPVESSSKAEIANTDGVMLAISPGSVEELKKFKIQSVHLPALKKSTKNYAVVGNAYLLQPSGYRFKKPIRLEMPVSPGFDAKRVLIGKWDQGKAQWNVLKTAPLGSNIVVADLESFSLVAVLNPAKDLGMESLKLIPNPFSPNVDSDGDGYPGLSIELKATSKVSRMPFITIVIYNLLGQTVRTLIKHQAVEKDQLLQFHWDGLTDDGRMARNGRYVVKVDVSDATGTKSKIKTVVLVK